MAGFFRLPIPAARRVSFRTASRSALCALALGFAACLYPENRGHFRETRSTPHNSGDLERGDKFDRSAVEDAPVPNIDLHAVEGRRDGARGLLIGLRIVEIDMEIGQHSLSRGVP